MRFALTTGGLAIVIAATTLIGGGRSPVGAAAASRFVLPNAASTKLLLEGAVHTSEFVDVATAAGAFRGYVSYPDRADAAPVVLLTTEDGMTDWARALAYQASRDGFIAVVPDHAPPTVADAAARQFATQIRAGNGTVATVHAGGGQFTVEARGTDDDFALTNAGWTQTLAFLRAQTGNQFDASAHLDHVAMEMRVEQAGRGGQAGAPQRPGLNEKPDHLPANWVMAEKIAATTPRRHEWVDVRAGNTRVRTWVVYPNTTARVGAVVVLTGAPGIREGDWELAVADQLAQEGFIALVPDFATGLGANGGHYDSFMYTDDRMQAQQKRPAAERLAMLTAVRDYAAKLPQSNGRTGSIGFCGGGTNSFRLAIESPEHNASVVFYGSTPPTELLPKVTAPVLAFYGQDDARVTADVEPTRAEMKRLGKSFEAHVYPHATHSFLWVQDLGNNYEATVDSWARTLAFYRQHLNTPAPASR